MAVRASPRSEIAGSVEIPAPEVAYRGPLNLLAALVRRGEIDVLNLSLSGLVESLPRPLPDLTDAARLGELLVVFGFLLRERRRGLFPRPSAEPDEEPPATPHRDWAPVAAFLAARWEKRRLLYGRRPPKPTRRYYVEAGPEHLAALAGRLRELRRSSAPELLLVRSRPPLGRDMEKLRGALARKGSLEIPGSLSGEELGLLLAALELSKQGEALLSQAVAFSTITITTAAG